MYTEYPHKDICIYIYICICIGWLYGTSVNFCTTPTVRMNHRIGNVRDNPYV